MRDVKSMLWETSLLDSHEVSPTSAAATTAESSGDVDAYAWLLQTLSARVKKTSFSDAPLAHPPLCPFLLSIAGHPFPRLDYS